MAIVSVAIVLSFHLKHKPTDVELRMAKPLGAIFWALSVLCLSAGVANYISIAPFTLTLPLSRASAHSQRVLIWRALAL